MIPISKPIIGKEEIALVNNAMESGWVSSQGNYIVELEKLFADYCGTKHCILLANGTVAIHLALVTLGIGPGDEVIVPDLTFVATANAVRTAGATPVFVDVRESDWCMDPEDVINKITSKTKAIIPVHIYGHPAEMDTLNQIAEDRGLFVIEDAAEAHGAEYKGKKVGGLGTLATFSFFGNKIITTGEGGAITTNSDEIAQRAKILRDHGMSKEKRYWYNEVGFNYRMTNLQAALGVAQMGKIEDFIKQRDEILNTYRFYLEKHGFKLNPHLENTTPVNWITCVLIEGLNHEKRDLLQKELLANGIDSRPFFYPVSSLPMYKADIQHRVTYELSNTGLNLPTYPGLTSEEIEVISEALINAVKLVI